MQAHTGAPAAGVLDDETAAERGRRSNDLCCGSRASRRTWRSRCMSAGGHATRCTGFELSRPSSSCARQYQKVLSIVQEKSAEGWGRPSTRPSRRRRRAPRWGASSTRSRTPCWEGTAPPRARADDTRSSRPEFNLLHNNCALGGRSAAGDRPVAGEAGPTCAESLAFGVLRRGRRRAKRATPGAGDRAPRVARPLGDGSLPHNKLKDSIRPSPTRRHRQGPEDRHLASVPRRENFFYAREPAAARRRKTAQESARARREVEPGTRHTT